VKDGRWRGTRKTLRYPTDIDIALSLSTISSRSRHFEQATAVAALREWRRCLTERHCRKSQSAGQIFQRRQMMTDERFQTRWNTVQISNCTSVNRHDLHYRSTNLTSIIPVLYKSLYKALPVIFALTVTEFRSTVFT